MKAKIFLEIIIALLVMLFIYAGSTKLLEMRSFRASMMHQPFPAWMSKTLATILPYSEIIIAIALGFGKTRQVALYAYSLLMLGFAIYTGMVVFNFFKHTPCGCGGIINELSWSGHFLINIIFLILTLLAILLNSRPQIFMHKQGVSQKPVIE